MFRKIGIALFLTALGALLMFLIIRKTPTLTSIDSDSLYQTVKNVVKISVFEVTDQSLVSFENDSLTIANLEIPFTKQKSTLLVASKATLGFNLEKVEMLFEQNNKRLFLVMPKPEVLSLDVQSKIIGEKDSFLNRIDIRDRNLRQERLRRFVLEQLASKDWESQTVSRTKDLLEALAETLQIDIAVRFIGQGNQITD